MSPVTKQRRDGTVRPVRLRALQPSALVWLTVVWMALWGDISIANAVSGLVVAIVVCLVFPLPPVRMKLELHPVWLTWLVLHFLYDVCVASAEVAWKTLFLRREPRNAVIEVDLRSNSDLVLTIVANMATLVPGSVVVEARRSTHTLYLHVLDAEDLEGVELARRRTLQIEDRVVKAIGPGTTRPVQEAAR